MSDAVSVSVITPCYNGSRFLRQTLESVLAQTRPPLEVLVVDDGSTDDSAQVAESFGPPVRVIRQSNQGESVARNRALTEARGDYAVFLDADDLLESRSLERLADSVSGRTGAVALMGCAWFSEDPFAPYATGLPKHSAFYPAIIESNLAPVHCWFAPVELVRRAGGFLGDLQWFEDWDLWWRVGLLGPELVRVPHAGALYRRHPQSQLATTKMADRTRGHARLMGRMGTALLQRPEMIDRYGEQLFWSCFTALHRARANGVPWSEIAELADVLSQVAARGPSRLTSSWLARSMRVIGVRAAATIHALSSAARTERQGHGETGSAI